MSEPRTAAGRALPDDMAALHNDPTFYPVAERYDAAFWRGFLNRRILAIEAEAAAPYRKALERLVAAGVPPDALIGADPESKVGMGGESLKRWWFDQQVPALQEARALAAAREGR